jgi:hypothetical protein
MQGGELQIWPLTFFKGSSRLKDLEIDRVIVLIVIWLHLVLEITKAEALIINRIAMLNIIYLPT